MDYFYDLLVNLNDIAYEFYEWEKEDDIIHLKRIPVFRISKENFIDLICNDVKISEDFIKMINKKSEVYDKKNSIENIALFIASSNTLVLEFDESGNSIFRSKLLLEEELDVLEQTYSTPITHLDYKIVKPLLKRDNLRQIKRIINVINTEINYLYDSNNIDKLKYLYIEVTNKYSDNIDKIKNELLDIIKSDFSKSHLKLYEIVMLSYKHLSS